MKTETLIYIVIGLYAVWFVAGLVIMYLDQFHHIKANKETLAGLGIAFLVITAWFLIAINVQHEGFGDEETFYLDSIQYQVGCDQPSSGQHVINGEKACFNRSRFTYPPYGEESDTYFITMADDKIVIRKNGEDQFIALVTSIGSGRPSTLSPKGPVYHIGEVEIMNSQFEILRDLEHSSVYYSKYPDSKFNTLMQFKNSKIHTNIGIFLNYRL